jgi:[CysO sulfur-carrier protein]-S-L-cysteine hydrolase
MTLTMERPIYDAMLAAARKAAPLEACGLLGGRDRQAVAFYELSNTDASGEHYTMAPEEQFAAVKDMRTRDLRMLAIWHSHPATPARMSQEDLRLAYTPDAVYVILSLADSDHPDVRGFTVVDGTPSPVEMVVRPANDETPTPSPGSETS